MFSLTDLNSPKEKISLQLPGMVNKFYLIKFLAPTDPTSYIVVDFDVTKTQLFLKKLKY